MILLSSSSYKDGNKSQSTSVQKKYYGFSQVGRCQEDISMHHAEINDCPQDLLSTHGYAFE